MKKQSKVFISYRREGGSDLARSIQVSLKNRGYDVFMDVEDLRSGPFNTALYEQIETSTDVVVVLTPGSLDRCINKNDWLRIEVAYAIKCKSNIVPVMAKEFDWPATLPDDLKELPMYHGIERSHELFEASIDKLSKLLIARLSLRRRFKRFGIILSSMVLVCVSLFFSLFIMDHLSSRKDQTSYFTPMVEAQRLFDTKDYASAFHTFSQLSDMDLDNINLHRNIEQCARRGGLVQKFLERYRKQIQQNPNSAVLHNYLGNALLLLDPNDTENKAQAEYRKAIRLDNQFSLPLMNLGIIAFRMGKYAEAEDLFNQYLKREPLDSMGWTNLGMLYTSKVEADSNNLEAIDDGRDALDKALQLDPGSALAYKTKGRILAASGHKTEALKAFQLSLSLDYEQPEVRRQFELLAWDLGTHRLIVSGPDDMQTRSLQGAKALSIMEALERGQFERVKQECRALTAQDPENPLFWQLLAEALKGLGHVNKAQEVSNKAISLAMKAE
jgi:tetratricopeptide (TPR) repeat protein